MEKKYSIFHIEGGLGKHIMATAMVKVLRKYYPKSSLHVVCAYPDVFKHNPLIDRVHKKGQHGNFYETYIKDKQANCKVFFSDPYHHSDYILNQDHLFNIWCKQWEMKYEGESPEIYFHQPEIDYFTPFYKRDKPILVIQPNGGPKNQGFNYSWTRDIPESNVLDIINYFKKDYTIVHIKREDQKDSDAGEALHGSKRAAPLLDVGGGHRLAHRSAAPDALRQIAPHLEPRRILTNTFLPHSLLPEVFRNEQQPRRRFPALRSDRRSCPHHSQ